MRAQNVTASAAAVQVLSLDEAIRRAEANEPAFALAAGDSRIAELERKNARAGLLPSVTYHNEYLYTQGTGTSNHVNPLANASAPRYIANNAVHEYASQGVVTEKLGLSGLAAIRAADADAARSAAELEVARRGLLASVVTLYYGVVSSGAKWDAAVRAAKEADDFVTLTQQREAGRESAHADVVKAQLEQQQRQRDLADLRLSMDKARLELGVLLFPNPRTNFGVDAGDVALLPERSVVDAKAGANNAELKSALASFHSSLASVSAARAAYLPELSLNYTYGIDAAQFAVRGPDGFRNLGYAASATLDIPVWDWLSTERKVKQSEIRRDAAKVALTAVQRRAIANLAEFYDEAAAARDQLASLDLSLSTAQESLRLTKLRYQGGEGTVLEVVDAQKAMIAAENARADGVVRYRLALAQLQTLTGRF